MKQQTSIGGLYGGGIAYEISPSFDIRAEYRGFVTKVPTFGDSQFTTNKWYNIYNPASAWRITSKKQGIGIRD